MTLLEIKNEILRALKNALISSNLLLLENKVVVERSKKAKFGFYNTNLPFLISSVYGKSLEESKEILFSSLPSTIPSISKIEYNSGYLNFYLSSSIIEGFYTNIHTSEKILLSPSEMRRGEAKKYFIEIISANPTGRLHIGHIRNGIIADTLANFLEYTGERVYRAYLVNDCGTQVRELISSVYFFYHSGLSMHTASFMKDEAEIKYTDITIQECAKEITSKFGCVWRLEDKDLTKKITAFTVEYFLNLIKSELRELSIEVDSWDYESKFGTEASLKSFILEHEEKVYVKENALWFKTSQFSSETNKDDVIMKTDGSITYFGQDLIYHTHKLNFLGKDGIIINTLSEDHSGHIIRMTSFFTSIGVPRDQIKYRTIPLSRLIVEGKKVIFSRRNNTLLTLPEIKEELNYDEIRWLLSHRDEESELDIELSKLKDRDYNNQIFYILYAYSRSSRLLSEINITLPSILSFEGLNSEIEADLIYNILWVEEKFKASITHLKPSILASQLYTVSKSFHVFYEYFSIKNDPNFTTKLARLGLVYMVYRILSEALPLFRIHPRELV